VTSVAEQVNFRYFPLVGHVDGSGGDQES
jgi:hypothetical protein